MRILPDTPHLDFLRREAKNVLAALRERDPRATLSLAQRHVAEQYGLRTWPELKAEVERRRASPPPADPELGAALAAGFDLGHLTLPMTPIAYAIMGRRWRLHTERGSWLATPVFDWIDEAQVRRAAELRERARADGVHAPAPVRTSDGNLLLRVGDQGWRVDHWTDLGPEVLEPVRSSVAREVGHTLATLHDAAPPTDQVITPGQPGHLTSRHPDADWDQLVTRTAEAGRPWLDDLIAWRAETLPALEAIPFRPAPDPLIVCINDLNSTTVRLGAADELVLTHWDFAGPNHPEWELAYVLVHWAGHPPVNPGTARALVDGYREHRRVPALDRSSFWLAITANLNWTYNQFCFGLRHAGDQQSYAEGELRQLLDQPLSVTVIDRILAELR